MKDVMNRMEFEEYEDLARHLDDTYEVITEFDEDNDISIIATYWDATSIIEELIDLGYSLHTVDLHHPDIKGYADEFVISIIDYQVWCEPLKRGDGYIDVQSTCIYVMDDCSSKVIPHCRSKYVREVSIADINECDCDDEECSECCCEKCDNSDELDKMPDSKSHVEYRKGDDGIVHGFIADKRDGGSYHSVSYYGTDELDKASVQSLLHELGF